MTKKQSVALERRSFLKGTAAAGSAAALVAVSKDALTEETVTANSTGATAPSRGYRETSHVRDFYASLRI